MKTNSKKWALWITVAMTLVVLAMRVVFAPAIRDATPGTWHISYLIIGLMAVTVLAVTILICRVPSQPMLINRKLLLPTALFSILCGTVMALVSAVDLWRWFTKGETPPPNAYVISKIDGVALFFCLVFGVLGGAMLVRLGLSWIKENKSTTGFMRLWALAPVVWMWMRLARYEISYASAVDVGQSFYDFVMLIFILLFFFALARFISGIGYGKTRFLLVFSLLTAMFTLSGTSTRLILYMMQDTQAYYASQLAGFTDFMIGVFALLFACGQIFGERMPVEKTAEETEQETEQDSSAFNVDSILQELYPKE